jgi:hypothetical protein
MPKFLEKQLQAEYGPNSAVPYKVMNAIGAMHVNRETPKGARMQAQHDAKVGSARKAPATAGDGRAAALASHPHAARLGKFLHPKKHR